MKHVRGLTTIEQALRQVFLSSTERPLNASLCTTTSRIPYHFSQRRNATTSYTTSYRPRDPESVKNPGLARRFGPGNSTFPIVDEEISEHLIRVVEENKQISDPQELQQVLRSIDRKQFFLVQVSPPTSGQLPLCKIVEKKQVFAHQAEVDKKNKKPKSTAKRIELGWHVDRGDLRHKMEKLKQFLEEGRKVEVEVHTKKRKQPVTLDVAEAVLKRIRGTVSEVNGARETKSMIGTVGKLVTLFLEGKPSQ